MKLLNITTPVSKWSPAKETPHETIKYIDIASVSRETKRIESIQTPLGAEAPSRARQLVEQGDILVSTVRPNLNAVALVSKEHHGSTASTGFCVLRPNPEHVSSEYLFHWVKTPQFVDAMVQQSSGASYPAVTDKIVKSSTIPLPPLAEQRRIAAILDQADALRQKRSQAIVKLDQLLQSIFLDMFGDPITNSKMHPMVTLGDLGKWQSGGTPTRKKPHYFQGDIPWYSSGELNEIFISSSQEYLTHEALESSAAKLIPPGGLLLGMYDTAAFKSSITKVSATCNQAIAFAKIDETKANTVFVYQLLQLGKEHYRRLQRGVRQKNLNLNMVKETRIPLPPVDLQNTFSVFALKLLHEITQQQESLAEITSLFSALQQRAFSGNL